MNRPQQDPPGAPNLPNVLVLRASLTDQVFSMRDEAGTEYCWNVTRGLRIAKRRGDQLAFYPARHGITCEHLTERYEDLNEAYALTTDLSRPLLFVPFEGRAQLVDGWHRLYRAVKEGALSLPAFLLTEEEARSVLLYVLPMPPALPARCHNEPKNNP